MPNVSKFMVSAGRPARIRAERRNRTGSGGVDVVVRGWKPGLRKVRLTQILRDGGIGLAEATRLTGEILDGNSIRVHLDQFDSVPAARRALTEIGVNDVAAA